MDRYLTRTRKNARSPLLSADGRITFSVDHKLLYVDERIKVSTFTFNNSDSDLSLSDIDRLRSQTDFHKLDFERNSISQSS